MRYKRKSKDNTSGNINQKNKLTQEEIKAIIGSTSNNTKNTEKNTNTKNLQNKNTTLSTHKNHSAKINELINKKYKHLFYITLLHDITRRDMSEIWEKMLPQSDEIIIQTKKCFS